MAPRLSLPVEKKILLHLMRYEKMRSEWEVPFEISQEGISNYFGLLLNNVSRSIGAMKKGGLVDERLAHVRGLSRRRKVYFPSQEGIQIATEAMRELNSLEVDFLQEEPELKTVMMVQDVVLHLSKSGIRATPLDVYRILESRGVVSTSDFSVGGGKEGVVGAGNIPRVSLFVGRNAELNDITGALESKKIRLIVIEGLPGIGKTTLAAKSLRVRKSDGASIVWLECYEWDTPQSLVERLCEGIFVKSGNAGHTLAESVIAAGRAIGRKSVIIVLDDYHNLQDESRQCIDGIYKTCSGVKILAVSRTHPEMLPLDDPRVSDSVFCIKLGGLEEGASKALLPSLSEAQFKAVYRKTGGLPLFLVLASKRGPMNIDEGIDGFLKSEIISSLSAQQREILGRLAILEGHIPRTAIVLNFEDEQSLAALRDRHIIEEFADEMYIIHNVIRDLFLSSLSPEEMKSLHRFAAQYHKSVNEPTEAARHHLAIDEYAPALEMIREAVEERDYYDARQLYTMVSQIESGQSGVDELLLGYVKGAVLIRLGMDDAAIGMLGEARVIAKKRGDDEYIRDIALELARVERTKSNYDSMIASYKEALDSARRSGNKVSVIKARLEMGKGYRRAGKYDEAVVEAKEAVSLAKKAGLIEYIVAGRNNLAMSLCAAGDVDLARDEHKQAIRDAHAIRDLHLLGVVYCNSGLFKIENGDAQSGYEEMRRGIIHLIESQRFSEARIYLDKLLEMPDKNDSAIQDIARDAVISAKKYMRSFVYRIGKKRSGINEGAELITSAIILKYMPIMAQEQSAGDEYEKGVNELEQSVHHSRLDNAILRFTLDIVSMLIASGRFADARQILSVASEKVKSPPADAKVAQNILLARVLIGLGKKSEARRLIEIVKKQGGEDVADAVMDLESMCR